MSSRLGDTGQRSHMTSWGCRLVWNLSWLQKPTPSSRNREGHWNFRILTKQPFTKLCLPVIHGYPIFSQAHSQNLFLLEHQQRPEFNSTTSPGYWGPLSETTAQEFHPVAQCDQWPLLFHAVQEHILFQTHIKPSTTFVHSHGQCATHQINEIQYNNVTRVLRTPQWNHSTRVSSRRTVWSMTPVVPCSATAYPHRNPHQTLYNFCSFTWSMCDPSD